MRKRFLVILAVVFLTLIILIPTQLMLVSSASGYIKINGKTASIPGQQVQVGCDVSLYFGDLTLPGYYSYLVFSQNGLPELTSGDFAYTPSFITSIVNSTYSSNISTSSGKWIVQNGWINGSIPRDVGPGNYYIKICNQQTLDVIPTDTYISVVKIATLQVSPSSGAAGVTVQFTGSGFPASQPVSVSYFDEYGTSEWSYLLTVNADASGNVGFSEVMPDLRKSLGMGDNSENGALQAFKAQSGGYVAFASYNQLMRGIKNIGSQVANGLYGNGTTISNLDAEVGDVLTISGKWFHPSSAIYIRWDSPTIVGTVTGDEWREATVIASTIASPTGSFETAFIVPLASVGMHYLAVEDSETKVIISLSVTNTSSLDFSPNFGGPEASVQVTGSNYPPNSVVDISYQDTVLLDWYNLTSTRANSLGKISFAMVVPDMKKAVGSGDCYESYYSFSIRSEINGLAYCTAEYYQYARGLKTIGSLTATGIFGNGTDIVTEIKVNTGDTLAVTGKWFHPNSPIYVRWDGVAVVGTVGGDGWRTASIIGSTISNAIGSFETTITIPTANIGPHYISVEDPETKVIFKVLLSPATFEITPSRGTGGGDIHFAGTGYPPNSALNISYLDSSWKYWFTTNSNSSGGISFTIQSPDLQNVIGNYDGQETYESISYRSEIGDSIYGYVSYDQFYRGLKTVGSQTANGLYGNGMDLSSSVNIASGNTITIRGKYFHPGVIYVRWDSVPIVGTVTADQWQNAVIIGSTIANSEGYFEASVTIPQADVGPHFISIEDTSAKVIVKISLTAPLPTPTASPTPTSTPVSTVHPTQYPTGTVATRPTTSPSPSPTPVPIKEMPTIDISCKSTSTDGGFRVEIHGNLRYMQQNFSYQPILLSFSKDNGRTWESLTTVKTDGENNFMAVWMPSVSGYYLVKAVWEGDSMFNSATTVANFALTPDSKQNVFTVTSNSTITAFAFNSTSRELSFQATGSNGTTGYVHIALPKTLISDISTLKVYLDGTQIAYDNTSFGDSWIVTLIFSHSSHEIVMMIEDSDSSVAPSLDNMTIYIAVIVLLVVVAGIGVLLLGRSKKDRKHKLEKVH